MVINGVREMLANCAHITLTNTYLCGSALLEGLKQEVPDVLLLDFQLPDKTGDELAHTILKSHPDLAILTLTNFEHALYVNMMLNIGARGYLLKNTDQPTLIKAIETVHAGHLFIAPQMQAQMQKQPAQAVRKTASHFALTPREKDILKLIVGACSNQEIAEQLHLSLRTVENYRLNLSLKLEAKNTAALIRKALELGLAVG
jgi:DNA-binding NarL/FixJ family response regulator